MFLFLFSCLWLFPRLLYSIWTAYVTLTQSRSTIVNTNNKLRGQRQAVMSTFHRELGELWKDHGNLCSAQPTRWPNTEHRTFQERGKTVKGLRVARSAVTQDLTSRERATQRFRNDTHPTCYTMGTGKKASVTSRRPLTSTTKVKNEWSFTSIWQTYTRCYAQWQLYPDWITINRLMSYSKRLEDVYEWDKIYGRSSQKVVHCTILAEALWDYENHR